MTSILFLKSTSKKLEWADRLISLFDTEWQHHGLPVDHPAREIRDWAIEYVAEYGPVLRTNFETYSSTLFRNKTVKLAWADALIALARHQRDNKNDPEREQGLKEIVLDYGPLLQENPDYEAALERTKRKLQAQIDEQRKEIEKLERTIANTDYELRGLQAA